VEKMARYTKAIDDPTTMLFVEEHPSDVKCGNCNEIMYYQIYYKDKKTFDFLVCKKCNTFLQRIIDED